MLPKKKKKKKVKAIMIFNKGEDSMLKNDRKMMKAIAKPGKY